jgi:DNA repair protein RadD
VSAAAPILRDYQIEDVAAIRAAFAQYRRVLYVLPTGGGKTVVFSYVVAHAATKSNRVVVLGHRQEIADQIAAAKRAGCITPRKPLPSRPRHEGVSGLSTYIRL